MVKTLDANQTAKIDRPYIQPIYLVHILLSGLTLYFSDRNISYNNHNYEDYLFDLSDTGNEVRNLGGYDNCSLGLRFKNDSIREYNYLIELFDIYPPEKKYIEIYKLLINTGEVFGSDVSTRIFKGEMGQPYDIDMLEFKINCSSMLFGMNGKLPLDVIDDADFPSADPDDVGKYRNIVYGSVPKVICPWTLAGWATTIVEDITSSATGIDVSEVDRMPSTPFTAKCDNEEIRVTSNSGTNLTVTRGYGGTTATSHSKGAYFYEKISLFHAEVAQHPVKTIGDIFVERRGEWVRVKTGATKYIDTGGRAYVTLDPAAISFEEKINITVNTTVESEGSHAHSIEGDLQKTCYPTGSSGPTGHANVRDGNEDSYCAIDHDVTVTATFTETDLGTISKTHIYVYKKDTASVDGLLLGSTLIISDWGSSYMGWFRFIVSGAASWTESISVVGGSSGNQIGEIYKIVEYAQAGTEASAATGIDVDSTLSGNSVANLLIGDRVACNVEGYKDDGSGTYTGTPSALIERPDHIRKHILIALLGFSSDDIDSTSFSAAGVEYGLGGYKFSFNLPVVAVETTELFRIFDLCSRSNLFETQGKFHLMFNSVYGDNPAKAFDEDNVRGNFKFFKTDVVDIKNKIRAHYNRDLSKTGNLGDIYKGVAEYSDSSSITKYGTLAEDLELAVIGDLPDVVEDVIEWILADKKELKRGIEFDAFWDAMKLEQCDYFVATTPFWSGRKYKTVSITESKEDQTLRVKGIQSSPSSALMINLRPYDLFIRDDYCYVCGVNYHDSKYWLAVAKYEISPYYFNAIDYAEHDAGEAGSISGYYGIFVDTSHNVYLCGRKGSEGDYAGIVRKISGSDLASIAWTAVKEPTSDMDHYFNDVVKDGSYVYVTGHRYESTYYGLLYKLADSDGTQSWAVTDIAGQCFGIGPIHDSHLWVFGSNDSQARTIWKREDSDGSLDTPYTYDTNSKEDFRKVCSDGSYWYTSGKYVDGSNYEYGCSARIAKSDLTKDYQINRDSVAGTASEWSSKIVSDGTSGFLIGSYFDSYYEAYRAVFEKRPLAGSTADWTLTHDLPRSAHSAIGVHGNFIYTGTYYPGSYNYGYIERRNKSDGTISSIF